MYTGQATDYRKGSVSFSRSCRSTASTLLRSRYSSKTTGEMNRPLRNRTAPHLPNARTSAWIQITDVRI